MAQPLLRTADSYTSFWVVEWDRVYPYGTVTPITYSKVYMNKSSAMSQARKMRNQVYYSNVKVFQLDTKPAVKCIDLNSVKVLNNPQNVAGEVVY
jgi:hypothetical protein